MDYRMDRENNLYIIRIDSLNDAIFKEVISEILAIRGLNDKVYAYYTYFTKDYLYCILDFNKRKYSDDEIEMIAKEYVMKK